MKIIISHDVDHLKIVDHLFKDLFFPKFWIRSTTQLLNRKISFQEWVGRFLLVFRDRMHNIPELLEFDKRHGIPSMFFFGMANALGMSYSRKSAKVWIDFILNNHLDVSVHGIAYDDYLKMQEEFNDFKILSGLDSFGIRMHYVRYSSKTFEYLAKLGYYFDSSEFVEENIRQPYLVNKMWEFPLYAMDSYLLKDGIEGAKEKICELFDLAEKSGCNYFTFLFHDVYYNTSLFRAYKEFYDWFVFFCIEHEYEFVSYSTAINELENERV